MNPIELASLLALVANRLIAAFIKPIADFIQSYVQPASMKKFDKARDFVMLILSWCIAGLFGFYSGLDLYSNLFPDMVLLTRILTAVTIGGGANLIHAIFQLKPETSVINNVS